MKMRAFIIILIIALAACYAAGAEDRQIFILCNPKTPVIVRRSPKKASDETGRLDCGDTVMTDGKTRNGYLHVYGVTESGEGWIVTGHDVWEKPEILGCKAEVSAPGRVRARNKIGGKKVGWLQVGDEVTVYAMSEEWAVTNRGYVMNKYLEVWQ